MLDIKIINAKIIDGTSSPYFYGEIGIKDERIDCIAPKITKDAKTVIDALGKCVAPGFIDSHSHSDSQFLINPLAESKVRMGVTTEVIGQCGTSAAPSRANHVDFFGLDTGKDQPDFSTMGNYLSHLEKQGVAVNVIALVGHGNIRAVAMGEDDRPPSEEEMNKMKVLVREAMEAGAYGMSTGLIYPPGVYAKTPELVELSKVVSEYHGLYVTHMRNEEDHLLDSIAEVIEIAEKADLAAHISHFKACNPENWGLVNEGLRMVENARENGLDITFDQYPYIASSTSLKTLLPPWAHEGGVKELLERLKNHDLRDKMKKDILKVYKEDEALYCVMVSAASKEHNKQYEGMRLTEIASAKGKDVFTTLFDLLLDEEAATSMVRFSMCEDDVKYVMTHPLVMIGSDASCLAVEGPLSKGKPHPRAYGTFVRVLGKYWREERILSLEQAVHKMTGLPASRYYLTDRGLIKDGMFADIVIFDEKTVGDQATFTDPHHYASGIDYVLINGKVVLKDGQREDIYPGKVLRRK